MILISKTGLTQVAANIATILFSFFIGVQLLVATNIVPVAILWGSSQSNLTLGLRFASIGAALILGLFIFVIRYRAGLMGRTSLPFIIRLLAWVITGYMAMNVLGNLNSANQVEQLLFAPLAIILTVACLIVSGSKYSV